MDTNEERITDEEAMQAATAWGRKRYDEATIKASVADRTEHEVFVDLEVPEQALVMMVHVCRDVSGAIYVDQQEEH